MTKRINDYERKFKEKENSRQLKVFIYTAIAQFAGQV